MKTRFASIFKEPNVGSKPDLRATVTLATREVV
jgi:hypothetical protein